MLSKFTKAALFANLTVLVIGALCLFAVTDAGGIWAASACTASALLNIVGLIMLRRGRVYGFYFVFLSSLACADVLYFLSGEWLVASFGSAGRFAPYMIYLVYIAALVALLCQKQDGKMVWRDMYTGWDYEHTRHIYQLTAALIVVVVVIAIIRMPEGEVLPMKGSNPRPAVEQPRKGVHAEVAKERLDSPDVTLEEVLAFETSYTNSHAADERDQKLIIRISALKHLMMSGLMLEVHSSDKLVNICRVYDGEFSEQQQAIVDWFLSLKASDQCVWNECEKVYSLAQFKSIMKEKLKR